MICPRKFSLDGEGGLHPLITGLPDQHTFHTKTWLPSAEYSSPTLLSHLEKNKPVSRTGMVAFLSFGTICLLKVVTAWITFVGGALVILLCCFPRLSSVLCWVSRKALGPGK